MPSQLDHAFVDLSYRGWDKMKSGMGQLKSIGKDVGDSFDTLAGKATTTFASVSAAILGTTRAASPQVFDTFTGSLKALATVVGASVTPLLIEMTNYVGSSIKWWVGLDKATKDSIVSGLKWTAVISGAIVAFSTLNSTFGGFVLAAIKFAAANPMLAAMLAVAGAIALVVSKFHSMNSAMKEVAAEAKRIQGGDVTQDDIDKSWVGKDLMAIKDPAERAAAAQRIIDQESQRGNDAANKYNSKGVLSQFGSDMGRVMGINTDSAEADKVITDSQRNVSIAAAIRDQAVKGKDLNVKAGASKQPGLFDNIMGLGMQQKAVQVGDISSVWKNIQQAQAEDPSLAILKKLGVYQEANNELLGGIKAAIEKQNTAQPIGG